MLNNIIFQTDALFFEPRTIVSEQKDFWIIRMPENPTYYFGNFMYLKEAPSNELLAALEAKFRAAFSKNSVRKHYTFVWNGLEANDLSNFEEKGYNVERVIALSLDRKSFILPKKLNSTIQVKAFDTESDWQQLIELEVAERDKSHEEKSYRVYLTKKISNYRILSEQGKGNFYGAFSETELVASMGLFFTNTLGRFQAVMTKSNFRKQKICTTLLNHVIEIGLNRVPELVIVADIDYYALELYEKFGFKRKEGQTSICWWERTQN